MQADGLIVEDAAPDGTPKMRRARRVYQLTDAGKQRFAELVADTGPQNYTDDGFASAFFTLAEARMRIWRGAVVRSRNAERACAKQSQGRAVRLTATPASFTSWGWSPVSAK